MIRMIAAKVIFGHGARFEVGHDIQMFFTRVPGNKYSKRVRVKEIIRDNIDYGIVIPMDEKDGRQTIHINHDSLEIVLN